MKVKTPPKPSVIKSTGIHGNKMNSLMAKAKKPAPMNKNMKVSKPKSY